MMLSKIMTELDSVVNNIKLFLRLFGAFDKLHLHNVKQLQLSLIFKNRSRGLTVT
jgi:hypothetical protein